MHGAIHPLPTRLHGVVRNQGRGTSSWRRIELTTGTTLASLFHFLDHLSDCKLLRKEFAPRSFNIIRVPSR